MKKNVLLFIAALLTLGNFSSCSNSSTNDNDDNEFTSPIEIPITEYALVGTSCQWANRNFDGKVIVINSDQELEKYISCTNGRCPAIDFSKYTLLLTNGGTSQGVSKIETTFTQIAKNKFILNVKIHLNITAVAQGWSVSVLVPKISSKAIVALENETSFY